MKKKKKCQPRAGAVTAELRAIYQAAKRDGIWIREFAPGDLFMAAAGPISKIEKIEKEIGREIDIEKDLSLGDCVNLAAPGTGATREEACRNAVAACKKSFKMP